MVKLIFNQNQKVKVKWNSYTRKYFEELGYTFSKLGEEFEVFAYELQPYSNVKIEVVCDYCGNIYYPTYHNFYKKKDKKHCCRNCVSKVSKETCLKKYGKEHYSQTIESKEHKKQTFIKHYGVENPSQSKEIQNKKKETNKNKFGKEWFVESDEFKKQNLIRYGVENPMQNHEVREKAAKSITANNNYPTSKEENKFIGILKDIFGEEKCLIGQYCRRYVLDCLLIVEDIKIDIEYDGWYWHNLKQDSDKVRDEYMLSKGYKVLRFVSKGTMPQKELIIDCVKQLCETNQKFLQIQIDI